MIRRLIQVVACASLAWAGALAWYRFTGPAIPAPDTKGADRRVAAALAGARGRVVWLPWSAEAWGQYGRVLRVHEFVVESNVCFRRAEALAPSEPRWPYLLGKGLLSEDPEGAAAALRRAVAAGGRETAPHCLLAENLLGQGNTDEAAALFEEALKREPGNPRAQIGLGSVLVRRGELEKAEVQLRAGLQAAARPVRGAHAMLARIYGRWNRAADAERESKAADASPLGTAWPDPYQEEVTRQWTGVKAGLTRASAMWEEGMREQAVSYLQWLVREYPDSEQAFFSLGDCLNRRHDFPAAAEALRRAAQLDPKFARAHFELGFAMHQQGRPGIAIDHYKAAIALQPDFAVAYFDLSHAHVDVGEWKSGLEAVEKAIELEPGLGPAYRHLSKILRHEGREAEARAAMENADRVSGPPERARRLGAMGEPAGASGSQ